MRFNSTSHLILLLALLVLPNPRLISAPTLTLHSTPLELSADIENATLFETLELLARETHWTIFIEPGPSPSISTRFANQPLDRALPRLLGGLSFGLIRQADQTSHLYVYRTTRGNATLKIGDTGLVTSEEYSENLLADELILVLDPASGQSIEDLIKRYGAQILEYIPELNAYRLKFQAGTSLSNTRQSLAQEPGVKNTYLNYNIPRPESPEFLSSSGLFPPKIRPLQVPDTQDLIVGLVDTSLTSMNPALTDMLLPARTVGEGSSRSDGAVSHGSAMAETILKGIELSKGPGAYPIRILPIDVYGAQENTSTFDVAQGIQEAIAGGARIVNLSLGGVDPNPWMQELIANYRKQNVLFLAASGNDGNDTPHYPAAYPEVLAVTATDRQGQIAEYANYGSYVDVSAPGGSVIHDDKNQAFFGVGTSFATAYVSGIAASIALEKDLDVGQVEAQLRETLKPPTIE